jgi:hypothetical protein
LSASRKLAVASVVLPTPARPVITAPRRAARAAVS